MRAIVRTSLFAHGLAVFACSALARADAPHDFVTNTPFVAAQGARAVSMGGDDATIGNPALLGESSGTSSMFVGHHGVYPDSLGPNGGNLFALAVVSPRLVAPGWALRATFVGFDAAGIPTTDGDTRSTTALTRAALLEASGRRDSVRFGASFGWTSADVLRKANAFSGLDDDRVDFGAFPVGAGVTWDFAEGAMLGARATWMQLSEQHAPSGRWRSRPFGSTSAGLAVRASSELLLDGGAHVVLGDDGTRLAASFGAELAVAESVFLRAGVRGSTVTLGVAFPVAPALVEVTFLDRAGNRGEQAWLGERSVGLYCALTFHWPRDAPRP